MAADQTAPPIARTWREWRADPALVCGAGSTERRARFRPARVDELRPEWLPFIGRVAAWYCAGEADPARYPGQMSWCAKPEGWPPHWIPDEDLVEIDDA